MGHKKAKTLYLTILLNTQFNKKLWNITPFKEYLPPDTFTTKE